MTTTHDCIKTALRQADIEGFPKLGAPADEYNAEAKDIASALGKIPQDQMTKDKIIAVVALIWAKSFNLAPVDIQKSMHAFEKIAAVLISGI